MGPMNLFVSAAPVIVATLVAVCAVSAATRWRYSQEAALAVLVALLALVATSQFTAAFDGFDSDLWTYLLIVERVAAGQSVLDREPFLLEPPASPHVSAVWLGLGVLVRWLGVSSLTLARVSAFLSGGVLSWGAYRFGRTLFSSSRLGMVSLLLFWLTLPETWAALVLGRTLTLGFVLLATAEVLEWRDDEPRAARLGLWIALAFYSHLFGGVLAIGGAAVAWATRWREGRRPSLAGIGMAGAWAAALSAPCIAYALTTAGLPRSSAHVWRPGQVSVLGLSFLTPSELLAQIPGSVLLLAAMGLVLPAGVDRGARSVARWGALVVALVFFTPLYGLAASLFGAWMVPRFAVLAFPWVGATLAVAYLAADEGRSPRRRFVGCAAAACLLTVAFTRPIARTFGEVRGRPGDFPFPAEARREALSLRERLRDRRFLSVDLMGYALASPTLGQPLAVPPGHASPFGDFVRRQRRVHRVLETNTPECWGAFLALYPDVEYLVTPAAGANDLRAVWSARVTPSPEAVRDRLQEMGALQPVFSGRFFVLDALRPMPATSAVGGMGKGALCRQ